MKNKTIKNKLSKNELTIGSWLTIGHPSVAEVLARSGFEWITIDIEHNSIDPTMIQTLISTIQSYDVAAFVRVSKNDEVVIKHVLDAGADGIIVPMICSKEDAEKAVSYAKYPPFGKRGVGLSRAQQYGDSFADYKKWVESNLVVIAQIEHINAIENLNEIISTEGIDGTIIGPYDLSGSLNYPGDYDRQDVKDALEVYKKTNRVLNKTIGYHVIEPDAKKLTEKIDEGYRFLAFSTDFFFMGRRAKEEMSLLNETIKSIKNI